MEKINLVELLKDCPENMELDCTMYEDARFYEITDDPVFPVHIKRIDGAAITLTKYGGYADSPSAKCVIFPKGKTTWEGFVPPIKFKDGDIIYIKDSYDQEFCSIYKCIKEHLLYTYVDISLNTEKFNKDEINPLSDCDDILKQRLATDEEKEKLFQAIKDNGYNWNPETKTLEELTPDKFDINTLVPFESKVLIRDTKSQKWSPAIWGFYDSDHQDYQYKLIGVIARYCIPYEGNEHLLGKTDDCDEFYKTWEKTRD